MDATTPRRGRYYVPPSPPREPSPPPPPAPAISFRLPKWIGPVSFFAVTASSLLLVPFAAAFILGLAAFAVVEVLLIYLRPGWYRPTTLLKPASEKSDRFFDVLGQRLFELLDLCILWVVLVRLFSGQWLWDILRRFVQ